jgi:hypothetical protein
MTTNPKYEFRIRGHLDRHWLRHFEDVEILHHPDGATTIAGVMDQATVHGILNRIRDLGLDLIAVSQIPSEEEKNLGGLP